MIKYGVHSYLFIEQWSDKTLHVLDTAKELGAEVVELSVGDDIPFTRALTRRKAEESGISLTIGPGGDWPFECDLSADNAADRAKGLAWHTRQVDLCVDVGAIAYCGALYGHPGTVKRRRPPADEYPRTAEQLHQLAEYAARQGVKIVLEPMSHFRTHVVNTPDQLMRLITSAEHDNLYALLDTYHLVTEVRDFARAIHTVRDRLWGMHTCENDRGVPGGGIVPWESVFRALREIRFDGYIMLETYNSSLDDFAYQRGMFHDVCPDGWEFARKGFAFVRKHLEGISR